MSRPDLLRMQHALAEGAAAARRDGSSYSDVVASITGGHHHHHISAIEVEHMLGTDWRARREITQPASDLVSSGVEITGLPSWADEDAIQSWLEGDPVNGDPGSSPLRALGELWAEGESYGGAVMVAVAADGTPPSEPINLARLQEVISWEVLSKWEIQPFRRSGPGSAVDFWIVTGDASFKDLTSANQIIHPSRVVVHPGQWMPRRWMRQHEGWGLSRLAVLRNPRRTLKKGHETLGKLLQRSSQDVLTLAEKSELEEELGTALVTQKAREINASLSSTNFVFLDGGFEGDGLTPNRRGSDKFETMGRPLTGAAEIAESQHGEWRRGSNMPPVIADGEVLGGLNSGAEAGPWRAWASYIAGEQQRSLTHHLNWQLGLGFASKDGPTGGRVPDSWKAEWNRIDEPDQEIEAKVREIDSRTDKNYWDMSVLRDKELRQHRNVDGKGGPVRVESADILPPPAPQPAPAPAPAPDDDDDDD